MKYYKITLFITWVLSMIFVIGVCVDTKHCDVSPLMAVVFTIILTAATQFGYYLCLEECVEENDNNSTYTTKNEI